MMRLLRLFIALLLANAAHATLSVTGSTVFSTNNQITSFTLNRPASVNLGDLFLVEIGYTGTSTTVSPPPSFPLFTGWTVIRNDTNNPAHQYLFYHFADIFDVLNLSSTSWTLSGNSRVVATMVGVRASSTSNGNIQIGANFLNSGTGSLLTASSVTTTAPGMLLRFYSNGYGNGSSGFANGSTLTTLASGFTSGNGSGTTLFAGYRNIGAGATGSDTITAPNSSQWIAQTLLLIDPDPGMLDHFQFTYSTPGLTCEPQSIIITACADASCSSQVTTSTTVTLNTSGSWVGSSTQTFTGSTTLQLRQNTAGTATFSVASSSPSASNTNTCNGTTNNTCSLAFVDAGLEFDVPNLLANKPSAAVRLRAVKNSGDPSNSCVALFQNTTQSINFWSTYSNPTTGTRAVELHAGSGGTTYTSISGSSSSPTALSLTFDANGATTFEARYQDAGVMALNARFSGGTTGTYAGLVLNGSDSFVSTPVGLCVQSSTPNLNKATYTACNSNYDQCDLFVAAGSAFNLSISARAWESATDTDVCTNNSITPNYVQSAVPLSVQLIAPSSGTLGSINRSSADITSNGIVTYNDMTQSEVGVFTFSTASLNYFGQTIPAATSINYGRFFPHHFSITAGSTLVNRATSCTSTTATFTYLGETLNLSYQINALNASNALTQNYQGAFTKLTTFAQMNTAAIAPSPRTALAVTSTPTATNAFSTTWNSGRGNVISPVSVTKSVTPAGVYTNTAFGVVPTDSDGVTTTGISSSTNVSSVTPLDLDTTVPADAVNDHAQIGSTTELRYGRLRLNSASGPSDMDLPIPVIAEYYSDSTNQFVTNTADSCTVVNGAKAVATPTLGASAASGNAILSNGQSNTALIIKAPGAGIYGDVNVTLDLTATDNYFPWLQFDWDNNAATPPNPTATASLGTYRGSDRVIFWQETQ